MDDFKLSKEEHDTIFSEEIERPWLERTEAVESPTAIIIGGQPGAGKSSIRNIAIEELRDAGGSALVDVDDLREKHTEHENLLKKNDKTAALFTHHDASLWAKGLTNSMAENSRNIVYDGTMKDMKKSIDLASKLKKEHGYRVEAKIIAVKDKLSEQGVLYRYEDQKAKFGYGRNVPKEIQKEAYRGLPESVMALEKSKAVDKITIYNRSGEVLYENTLENGEWKPSPNNKHATARETLEAERNRPCTEKEKNGYVERAEDIERMLEAPERQATKEDIEAAQALKEDGLLYIENEINNAHYESTATDLNLLKIEKGQDIDAIITGSINVDGKDYYIIEAEEGKTLLPAGKDSEYEPGDEITIERSDKGFDIQRTYDYGR